jgi:hypothetical protein
MTVKAKFSCEHIQDTHFNGGHVQRQVQFRAVYGKDGTENGDYSKYTPFGELKMNIDKETAAYDAFQPGKEYYLTFEAAE